MALNPNKEVDYYYAEIEYDVIVPVYEGGEYEPEEEEEEEE